MIKERKTFDFMDVLKVEVQMRDDTPEGFREVAVAGVYSDYTVDKNDNFVYRIWFKNLPTNNAVVHETYHLFCTLMGYLDAQEHCWFEINSEIYAYNFHTLFDKVLTNLTSMKYYKELWDKEKDKCQN